LPFEIAFRGMNEGLNNGLKQKYKIEEKRFGRYGK